MHSEPLQHHRGGLYVAYTRGNPYEPVGRSEAGFRVGTGQRRVGHAVADSHVAHARPYRFDYARAFIAGDGREVHGIESRALVGVDEVHANRGMAQAHLSRTRLADWHVG